MLGIKAAFGIQAIPTATTTIHRNSMMTAHGISSSEIIIQEEMTRGARSDEQGSHTPKEQLNRIKHVLEATPDQEAGSVIHTLNQCGGPVIHQFLLDKWGQGNQNPDGERRWATRS